MTLLPAQTLSFLRSTTQATSPSTAVESLSYSPSLIPDPDEE